MLSLLILVVFVVLAVSKPLPKVRNVGNFGTSKIDISYTNCTKSTAEATLESVLFDPKPPEKTDSNWTAIANARVKEAVTGGSWSIKAYLGPFEVLDETGDLCKAKTVDLPGNGGSVTYEGVQCPTGSSGIVTINMTANVASSDPSVTVKIDLSTQDQNGKDLICVQIHCKLS
eukprot:52684_1